MSEQNQKETKEAPPSESELKSSQPQTQTSPYSDPREKRLGLFSEDPKFQ